jgi:hypothetical protein
MLMIIGGLLAGLVGALVGLATVVTVLLPTAVKAAPSSVLSLYQSIARVAVAVKTARGSTSTEARFYRNVEVKKLAEGRRNIEESRLAA